MPLLLEAGAEAVALYGSAARGEADVSSDLDIMAVFGDAPPRPSELRKRLGRKGDGAEVSRTTWSRFQDPKGQWAYFRMVAEEAVFLHDPDGRLEESVRSCPRPDAEQFEKCADRLSGQLRLYQRKDDLKMFNGLYSLLYADSYRWSKVAVMDANAFAGVITHRRPDAFQEFGERHPELSEELAWLRETEPFYLENMGKEERAGKPPFSYHDTTDEAWLTLCAAQEVIDVACAEMRSRVLVPRRRSLEAEKPPRTRTRISFDP